MPFQSAARFMSLLRKLRTNFGNTGAINPSASMSSMTVTKMNAMAAGRAFIFEIDNCRGGCVSRKIQIAQVTRLQLQLKAFAAANGLYN